MSDVLTGNPNHITAPLTATITALTASPTTPLVRVTTSSPHYFGPGDTVEIATGVVTGTFTITVIDATHFDLLRSTYTATSTGTATDLFLTPQIQVPTDGDPQSLQLSGMLSALQGILDRTQYLNEQIGEALTTDGLQGFICTINIPAVTNLVAVVHNGAPVSIETSASHGLQAGMWVQIASAGGTPELDGNWEIQSVPDPTHILIDFGVTGTYTGGGTVTPIVPPGVNALILDGWGGGGGGEGGGGVASTTDASGAWLGPNVMGGGGAGARRTTAVVTCTPLATLAVAIGAGGAGGAGATSGSGGVAGAGSAGTATTCTITVPVFPFPATTYNFNGGDGAGGGQLPILTPALKAAFVAPGGRSHSPNGEREWFFVTPGPSAAGGFVYAGAASNLANFTMRQVGDGGAAVCIFGPGPRPTGSQNGAGSDGAGGFVGGTAGTAGNDSLGSPNYLGGPGGGGGGAGPGGPGGNGGNGTAANASGNSSAGQNAPSSWSPIGTGAGGGGGGTAGAASGTTGNGGAGSVGNTGQLTIYWAVPAQAA
jgi:hypothetical protein